MLDFGWAELFLLLVVAVFVMKPDDLPALMRQAGNLLRRFQYFKFAMRQQVDNFMNAQDLADIQRPIRPVDSAQDEPHDTYNELEADEDYSVPDKGDTLPPEENAEQDKPQS